MSATAFVGDLSEFPPFCPDSLGGRFGTLPAPASAGLVPRIPNRGVEALYTGGPPDSPRGALCKAYGDDRGAGRLHMRPVRTIVAHRLIAQATPPVGPPVAIVSQNGRFFWPESRSGGQRKPMNDLHRSGPHRTVPTWQLPRLTRSGGR